MNQRRTILGACEYSIQSLVNMKKSMMDLGDKNQEISWAIGGIVSALSSNLLQICDSVFSEALQCGEPNAKQDLMEIKTQFNEFIENMIELD